MNPSMEIPSFRLGFEGVLRIETDQWNSLVNRMTIDRFHIIVFRLTDGNGMNSAYGNILLDKMIASSAKMIPAPSERIENPLIIGFDK